MGGRLQERWVYRPSWFHFSIAEEADEEASMVVHLFKPWFLKGEWSGFIQKWCVSHDLEMCKRQIVKNWQYLQSARIFLFIYISVYLTFHVSVFLRIYIYIYIYIYVCVCVCVCVCVMIFYLYFNLSVYLLIFSLSIYLPHFITNLLSLSLSLYIYIYI